MIHFVVPGEPMAQPRVRFAIIGDHVRTYEPSVATNYKHLIQSYAAQAMSVANSGKFIGPVDVTILAVFSMPKSKESKRKPKPRSWKTGLKDWDNIGKIFSDAMESVVYLNDKQVARGTVTRVVGAQGEPASVSVWVTQLDSAPPPA